MRRLLECCNEDPPLGWCPRPPRFFPMRTQEYKLADGRSIVRNAWYSFGVPHFRWWLWGPGCQIELLPIDTEPEHIIL